MANNETTLNISTLWRVFKKHAIAVIIFTILAATAAGVLAVVVLEKRYAATATFYVENRQTETIATIGDINTARSMVNDCIRLFSTHRIRENLAGSTNLNYTANQLERMINMFILNNTSFFDITITMDDPQKAVNTLNTFVNLCIEEYEEVIGSGKIVLVDPPIAFSGHVFPSASLFIAGGFLAGFVLSFILVFLIEVLDTKVKAEDDLFNIYDIPVFAEILNFDATAKGEYGYEYK
jgi:capsular polysaccharide biosynthesis protein